jgi:hypothetical protein
MQVYLGSDDGDILEGIKQHALDTDHSLSWAARDLLRLGIEAGAKLIKVPVVGDIRQEFERREAGES